MTLKCRECGRPLTDDDSVARGVGPDCAEKAGLLTPGVRKASAKSSEESMPGGAPVYGRMIIEGPEITWSFYIPAGIYVVRDVEGNSAINHPESIIDAMRQTGEVFFKHEFVVVANKDSKPLGLVRLYRQQCQGVVAFADDANLQEAILIARELRQCELSRDQVDWVATTTGAQA